ncbi:hypothetical protein [Chishuiella sp.]|uniref:hypothetical protein n=1 Tax=Chishuiella sp. TaxID=1969467 RepID=UPI0028A61A02|nr:hypothetical protein [Chishuiella sp.]
MKTIFNFLVLFSSILAFSQNKLTYLKKNSFDITDKKFTFPQSNFNIIGFGAYHGSEKTEDVEIEIIKSVLKKTSIKYYLPETDLSIAHYFNDFLVTGDTILLKDLIIQYGIRVPQERTIEVYNKWKYLKKINDNLPETDKIKVLGIDLLVSNKYVSRHILEIVKNQNNQFPILSEIDQMVKTDTTSYSTENTSFSSILLKKFITDYENNIEKYEKNITNKFEFNQILKNLKISFSDKSEREKTMYENYLSFSSEYNFKENPQFLRMGFFHLEKSREGKNGYPSFFARLIENKIYSKEKVISIIGFLTKSEVLWDEKYNGQQYIGYTTEGGFGIGDYEKEYFRGIQNLKDAKISDETLFRLNKKNSPYLAKEPDLIEVIMTDNDSNSNKVIKTSTLDYLDYAVLISNSKASVPIFEMK